MDEPVEARLGDESATLIPEMLSGVELGMSLDELRAARPAARAPARPASDPTKMFLEEQLPNGANVMYGLERRSRRLLQVQVLSRMPAVEGIAPHLTAMNEQYGSPTGIWDCPDTEGLPTRRFTWRRAVTTVSDVFLVHPGGVSVTLYIAPSEVIERSLRMSSCRPVRSREELETFPVATAEQIQAQRR